MATYSQLGVLGGGRSIGPIEVEGNTVSSNREVPFDRVAANYFSTLGIPVRAGRDVAPSDTAGSATICIVNETFVRTFLAGRHPLGMHVTMIESDGTRVPYEIVGVVADARVHELRGGVQPRFFVPAEQRRSMSTTRTFAISTMSPSITTTNAIRDAVTSVDRSLALSELTSMDAHLSQLTVEERAIAQLAAVFGMLALTLAAIGLFGVLSYGVNRRITEIAVRMALGAPSGAITAMIVRETLALILIGVAAGGVLAFYGSRFISARLYGVAPHDPLTLAAATAVLLIVAGIAAYLPARRASSSSPLAVLQRG
jgi:ABC-type antimicrobial peptide transport system permease subunit